MAVVVLSRKHVRHRLTVGGELLGLLLSPFHQLGETGLGFVDRPATQGAMPRCRRMPAGRVIWSRRDTVSTSWRGCTRDASAERLPIGSR
jgi:hypothetical protein